MTKEKLEVGDRVAAINNGKVAKGRVVEVVDGVATFVTFAAGGDAVAYDRDDVMLLYRTVQTPNGIGFIPFVIGAQTRTL